jgi:hypothetical protein
MSRRHDAKQRQEELTAFTLFAKLSLSGFLCAEA